MEKVIFDTNFIRNTDPKQFLGGRNELEKFSKVSELIFPDIVIEEIKHQKKRNLTSKKQSFLDNPFHWLKNLNKDETNSFDIDAHINDLERNEEIKYEVIRLTDSKALDKMKKLALSYEPPFAKINKDDKNNTDKGFKDAYIFLTVMEYLQSITDKNVFVCTYDGRLKEALENEPNIVVIKDYSEFKSHTIKGYQTDYFIEKLQNELQDSNIVTSSIFDYWFNINDNHVLLIQIEGKKIAVEIDAGEIVTFEKVEVYSESINTLINSATFATTHSAIEALNPYLHFLSDDEVLKILHATQHNNQIFGIANDEDVKQLLSTLYEYKKETLSPELKTSIEKDLNI